MVPASGDPDDIEDLEDEADSRFAEVSDDVASRPSETGDPQEVVERKIPGDILRNYEVYSYRNAAVILNETRKPEFDELLEALREFRITKQMIRTAGGNESDIPKILSSTLRPKGWHETTIQGDLQVTLKWKEPVTRGRNNRSSFEPKSKILTRARFVDGHKIDYVKERVAFDLEWNSKDQTFDRDLYALRAFSECGAIDVGVLLTRSASLNPIFRKLGPSLSKTGEPEFTRTGTPRMTYQKYGASTTWMGKLLYRLNAGRNGSCPVLAVGIKPGCISDWTDEDDAE